MFSLIKFLSGFNIFNGEKLGKLFFYGIIIIVCIGIYHNTFIRTTNHSDTKVVIQTVEKYVQQEAPIEKKERFFGIKIWNLKLGIDM